MQFEFDPERLIEEVKLRPGIWNYEDVNYRSMVSRHQLWNEIVSELIQPNESITKSEMRELVFQLQKKWKSIKDAFQKYIQNPTRTKRPYLYHRQLQFLLKNAEDEGTSESDDGHKKKKRNRNTWVSKQQQVLFVKDEDQNSDEYNDDTHDDSYQEATISYSNDDDDNAPLKKPRNSATAPNEFAFASVSSVETKTAENEDPDKMFLLSLLPHLKSIPESSRLSVKMELLQVLHNANFSIGKVTADTIS